MAKKQQSHMREERLVTEGYLDARLDGLKKDSNMRFDGFKKDITEGLDARLHGFKGELKEEIVEEMRGETVKILQAVDAVMTRFDATEKEEAAHTPTS